MRIEHLQKAMLSRFGRAMKLRVVSAGGCGACEADVNVLETISFDLNRFGISITASPRHADALLLTGPVSANMELALERPGKPCRAQAGHRRRRLRISGGIYRGLPDVRDGSTLPWTSISPAVLPTP